MNNRYRSGAGVLLMLAISTAYAQDAALKVEPPQLEQKLEIEQEPELVQEPQLEQDPPQTPPPGVSGKTEPEPAAEPKAERETAETFVPTEDISEDRSVSFPVDI